VTDCFVCECSKPRGIKAGRKLRGHRRVSRWADVRYKKMHLGTWLKANPLAGSSHAKGIVLEKM
jgi:small subunit ribosomal protein S23e